VKVLGNGELKKRLTVKAQRFSASARDKIVKAGGQCDDLPLRSIHHKPAAKTPAGEK
jgi:ribosomal protein L18E